MWRGLGDHRGRAGKKNGQTDGSRGGGGAGGEKGGKCLGIGGLTFVEARRSMSLAWGIEWSMA